MIIKRHNGINNRGIWPIILEGMLWLEENGYAEDNISVTSNLRAVVAYINDNPVGFIIYYPYPENNYLFINLSFVTPLHRQAGVYNYLWEEIKKITSEENCERILAVMHPDNITIHRIAEAQGFERTGITYEYKGIVTADQLRTKDAEETARRIRTPPGPLQYESFGGKRQRSVISTIGAPTGPSDDAPF